MRKYLPITFLTFAVVAAFLFQACAAVPTERVKYYDDQITSLGVEIVAIAADFETLMADARAALSALNTVPTPEQIQPYTDRYLAIKTRFLLWVERAGGVWKEAKKEFGEASSIIDRLIRLAESDDAKRALAYMVQLYGVLK